MSNPPNDRLLNLGLLPGLGGGFTTMAEGGQLERFIRYYLHAYRRKFNQITYFSYHNEKLAQFVDDPLLTEKLSLIPKTSSAHYRYYTLQMPKRFAQIFQTCDILRVFHTPGGIPALFAKRQSGIPFVTTYGYKYHRFSAIEGNRLTGMLLRLVEPFILRQAAAVIVTTNELQNYVQQWVHHQQIHLIPNGVDTAVFAPKPVTSLSKKPTILFVGRLSPQKNLPLLLDALAQVKTPFHLRIVGDGPMRESIVAKATRAGISFQLDGIRQHHELPAIFQSSQLFILPSRIEGHPKVLIEAMSCGLPCIVTNSEGNRALIQHEKNGLIIGGQDSVQLARQIERVLANPPFAAQLGANARQQIKARYHIHDLLQKEIALLQQVGWSHHYPKGSL